MNKNLIVILYFALAGIAVVILGLATIFAPDQVDKTVAWVIQILGLASTAAVTIYLLGKQSNDLAEVKSQTNGTLSKLRDDNASLNRQLLQVVGAAPDTTTVVGRHESL